MLNSTAQLSPELQAFIFTLRMLGQPEETRDLVGVLSALDLEPPFPL